MALLLTVAGNLLGIFTVAALSPKHVQIAPFSDTDLYMPPHSAQSCSGSSQISGMSNFPSETCS
jgi:hypothetical protein